MFCPNCGNKLNSDAQFCGSCGKNLSNNTPMDSSVERNTVHCGNCNFVGEGKRGRNIFFTILAWICLLFAPLITILYYAFTYKFKCPKCNSTFLRIKNKRGELTDQRKSSKILITIVLIIIGIAITGIMASVVLASLNAAREKAGVAESSAKRLSQQETIVASVVNVLCPGAEEDLSDASGGSGTIITTDGLVLTNSHIIPQDAEEKPLSDSCLVILPEPKTGTISEIYVGTPVIAPYLSSEYDLAAIQIEEPYVDEEGVTHGSYSKTFPAFDDSDRCLDDHVALGEPVRIFGYPALSGGYSLTITEGVVSSLPGDGLIVTSAKISSGNSGGLAVDQNGCMIGIPSMVNSDETESLGIIISNDLIIEFAEKFDALIKLLE